MGTIKAPGAYQANPDVKTGLVVFLVIGFQRRLFDINIQTANPDTIVFPYLLFHPHILLLCAIIPVKGGDPMKAKRANELMVVTLSAKTSADLEDVVNDWLKEQLDRVVVQDISFQQLTGEANKQVAWVVVTHESR